MHSTFTSLTSFSPSFSTFLKHNPPWSQFPPTSPTTAGSLPSPSPSPPSSSPSSSWLSSQSTSAVAPSLTSSSPPPPYPAPAPRGSTRTSSTRSQRSFTPTSRTSIRPTKRSNAPSVTDFTHKDSLRLLPKCNHVFHPHCIDSWLTSHVTCPVCRANLSQESSCHVSITVPPHGEEGSLGNMTTTTTEATQVEQRPSNDINQDCVGDPTSTSDTTKIIYISEEQHSSSELACEVELGSNTNVRNSTITNIGDGVVALERNLSRSNSTGHSLVEEQGKGVERYTLRLPEDVRRYILVNHGRSVQRSASVKGGCWSDSEESYVGKRVEKRWVICTPPFVAQHD
ncbi:E3 ubiquitin-protein ligase ATL6 [Glycine soja]|uniref:RING-type E3 ubiquitin transferase n=1 Tax=Glycine soja TaxID=3848 RepID=A0A0B2RAE4_GLYSO|nr:E3 ubiquitin-protein ligase ATL6 [Glycine soja]